MSKVRYHLKTSALKIVKYNIFNPRYQFYTSAWGSAASFGLKPVVSMQKIVV